MIGRKRRQVDDDKPAHPVLAYGCAIMLAGIVLVAGIVFANIVKGIWGMPLPVNDLHIVANTKW